jgi:hypothetical protein
MNEPDTAFAARVAMSLRAIAVALEQDLERVAAIEEEIRKEE